MPWSPVARLLFIFVLHDQSKIDADIILQLTVSASGALMH